MCNPAPCGSCGKTTWRGCGRHADEVMAKVPEAQRCTCPRPETGQPPLPAPPGTALPLV